MQPYDNQPFNHQHHNSFDPAYSDPHAFGQTGSFQHQNEWPSVENTPQSGLPNQLNSQPEKAKRMQLKSHGTKHAMQVEESVTQHGWFTVSIETAARLVTNDNQIKTFDWKAKTTIQLTRNELPVFIATMLGMLPYCKFSNHGEQNKWMEVENQADNFFMKTGGIGNKLHAIAVPITEAYLFGCLALSQFVKNFGGMNESAALTIIERMANQVYGCASYKKALEQKGPSRN